MPLSGFSLYSLFSLFMRHFPIILMNNPPKLFFSSSTRSPRISSLYLTVAFFISQALFWLIHDNFPYIKASTMSSLILPPKTLLVLTFLATYYLKVWPSMSDIFHLHSVPSYSLEVRGYYKIWCYGLFFYQSILSRSGGRMMKHQASEKGQRCGNVFTHQDPSSEQRNQSEVETVINIWKKLKFQKKSCYEDWKEV